MGNNMQNCLLSSDENEYVNIQECEDDVHYIYLE